MTARQLATAATACVAAAIAAATLATGIAAASAPGAVPAAAAVGAAPGATPPRADPRESHLGDLLMLTHGGQNAEAYWSPDGRQLIFQSTRPPFACDQIFRMPADGSGEATLVSTGKGRTTCAYFMPDGQRVLFSSTHAAGDACPAAADRSRGYVWAVYPTYDIWTARPDGSDLRRLTDNHAYDAETTVCALDGSMVFTSDRDGDLELYRMDADGSHVRRLTSTPGYDGGAYFSPDCKRIVWRASRPQGAELEDYRRLLAQGLVRPGKLEIWTANADGSDARQLTYLDAASFAPSFFPSGDRVIFSSNYGDPQGREFELWAVNLDGTGLERITWSPGFDGFPMFSPDGTRLAFSSNRGQSRPHETNVFVARWLDHPAAPPSPSLPSPPSSPADPPAAAPGQPAVPAAAPAAAGGLAEAAGPDGVLVARLPADTPIASRFKDEVRWLADPAREGRGIGSAGLDAAAQWLAERFRELGAAPAGAAAADAPPAGTAPPGAGASHPGSRPAAAAGAAAGAAYFQPFDVVVDLEVGAATALVIDGAPLPRASFQPAGFSASASGAAGAAGPAAVSAEVVAAGYGITAPELGADDYRGIDARGKIVVVRRFTPGEGPLAAPEAARRFGDLRYKAYAAREHGAAGLIVVDLPAPSAAPSTAPSRAPAAGSPADRPPASAPPGNAPPPADAPLPVPEVDAASGSGDAGIPVVVVTRAAGARLFDAAAGPHRASLAVQLTRRTRQAVNVVGVLRAGAADRLPGAVVVGAHYDHLGLGGHGSLAPDAHVPHLGADDNASGTAALLEAGRILAAERGRLRRDVYLVAFSGEEEGTLGSTAFTRHPPDGLRLADVVAMLNMDMVGRLRGNQLSVLGGETAAEWRQLVPAACARERVGCTLGGDGYGPSDHSPFYAAGLPVLHFFTGAHEDYHKPSDTADKINAVGGARVAMLVADLAREVAAQPARLAYKAAPAPAPAGDVRSYGASLGTVPDYAGDGRPGVLIGGVRPQGAAEQAGIRRGDLLIELAGTPIRDIYDFMYVLQRSHPGDTVKAVVDRGGQRLELTVTLGASQRPR
ncbi:MAG TPA: M28 family peptidase [Thermoanaerobaculia bacterium]|nr:M28 family peptidase [Thermoanaerobaculia bacterium]